MFRCGNSATRLLVKITIMVLSGNWFAVQVDVAAGRLRDCVVSTAESDLTSQAYWLSATLALGAFLKVCSPTPKTHH